MLFANGVSNYNYVLGEVFLPRRKVGEKALNLKSEAFPDLRGRLEV